MAFKPDGAEPDSRPMEFGVSGGARQAVVHTSDQQKRQFFSLLFSPVWLPFWLVQTSRFLSRLRGPGPSVATASASLNLCWIRAGKKIIVGNVYIGSDGRARAPAARRITQQRRCLRTLAAFGPFHGELELGQPEPFPPVTCDWDM